MNSSDIGIVFRKELLEIVRDRKTLALMLLVLIMYPVMLFAALKIIQSKTMQLSVTPLKVRILSDGVLAKNFFREYDNVKLIETNGPPITGLINRNYDVVVIFPPAFDNLVEEGTTEPSVRIEYDDRSDYIFAVSRVTGILDDLEDSIVEKRLRKLNLPEEALKQYKFKYQTMANDQQRSGQFIGISLPVALVVLLLCTLMYPAIDLVTGERERGTLGALLVSPATRHSLMIGKLLAVNFVGIISACLLILILFLMFNFGIGKLEDAGGSFTCGVSPLTALGCVPLAIPLIVSLSSLSMLIAAYARSFQQAQSYFVPYLMIGLVLAVATAIPQSHLPGIVSLIPIANVAVSMREVLEGTTNWTFILISFLASTGFAAFLTYLAIHLLDREDILFSLQTSRHSSLNLVRAAAVLYGVGMVLMFYIGQPVQAADPVYGMILTQVLVVALPSLVLLRILKLPTRETLSLTNFNWRDCLAACLLAPATILLGEVIVSMQNTVFPIPEDYSKLLMEHVIPDGTPLIAIFLAMAVLPGICEELMFRGAMQGLLSRGLSGAKLCIIVGVLFGVFHFSTYRLLPTAVLGIILAFIVYRRKSIYPAMSLHATHNALAVAISVSGLESMHFLYIVHGLAALFGLLAGFWLFTSPGTGHGVRINTQSETT